MWFWSKLGKVWLLHRTAPLITIAVTVRAHHHVEDKRPLTGHHRFTTDLLLTTVPQCILHYQFSYETSYMNRVMAKNVRSIWYTTLDHDWRIAVSEQNCVILCWMQHKTNNTVGYENNSDDAIKLIKWLNSHDLFTHILQGCFTGTGAICQWSKPEDYG